MGHFSQTRVLGFHWMLKCDHFYMIIPVDRKPCRATSYISPLKNSKSKCVSPEQFISWLWLMSNPDIWSLSVSATVYGPLMSTSYTCSLLCSCTAICLENTGKHVIPLPERTLTSAASPASSQSSPGTGWWGRCHCPASAVKLPIST